MKKHFNILSISDIHLGNKRTPTEHIINNLNKYVSNDKVLANIDLFIIGGDLFDSLLVYDSDEASLIDLWIVELLILCLKHNVILRVLRGTPSHDRHQNRRFNVIYEALKYKDKLDMKYIDTLSIDYIKQLDINILFIPDEWNSSNEETLLEAKELIKAKGLSKVDYAVIHGTFEHQLPADIKTIPRHNNKEYLDLVKHLIFIGHIHQHSIYDGRILSNGSFDRLGHGDEDPKGYIKVRVSDEHHHIDFIENKNAKLYKTIDVYDDDLEVGIKKISNFLKDVPNGSNIRIRTNKNNSICTNLSVFKTKWPTYIWELSTINEKEESILLIEDKPEYIPLIINEFNISRLILERIDKYGLDQETYTLCEQNLLEVINL